MKKCNVCFNTKSLDNFGICNGAKDGFRSVCKECKKEQMLAYHRTPIGLLKEIYNSQVQSSKKRDHWSPEYSKYEFINKFKLDIKYLLLHRSWVLSDYNTYSRPSFDRNDDDLGYSFDNINLVTWKENKIKAGTYDRPINKFSKNNKWLAWYCSISEASRDTGIKCNALSNALTIRSGYSGGYMWEYADKLRRVS